MFFFVIPFVNEGMATSSRVVVLLQDQHLLPRLGQDGSRGHPADPAPNDDGVQVIRDFGLGEAFLDNQVAFLLVPFVGFPGLAVIVGERIAGVGG